VSRQGDTQSCLIVGDNGTVSFWNRKKLPSSNPVGEFWAWWETAASRFDAAFSDGQLGSLVDEMNHHVHSINDGLEWEFGAGTLAKHALCVTAAGNSTLRSTAERWRLAAPQATQTWEYRSARSPDINVVGSTVAICGQDVAIDETRFAINADEERQVVDVIVHNPAFANMSEDAQLQLTFLVVDWLLGEDSVERWVGTIEPSVVNPSDSLPIDSLSEVVANLAQRHSEPTYAILQGTDSSGHPILVTTRRPLKRVEYPLFDLHGAIDHPYAEQTSVGLPGPSALDQVRKFEAHMQEFLGDRAILAAVVTVNGHRTFHIYCDSESDTSASVDHWLKSFPQVRVTWAIDHSWEATEAFN
jgi:hypothetical protein